MDDFLKETKNFLVRYLHVHFLLFISLHCFKLNNYCLRGSSWYTQKTKFTNSMLWINIQKVWPPKNDFDLQNSVPGSHKWPLNLKKLKKKIFVYEWTYWFSYIQMHTAQIKLLRCKNEVRRRYKRIHCVRLEFHYVNRSRQRITAFSWLCGFPFLFFF